jgi:hypothetical protein
MGKTASLANIGSIADSSLGFRNRLINSDMRIDQRNAGASFAQTNGAYNLDRWSGDSYAGSAVTGKYTVQQNAGSVTPPAGFSNYLGVTSTASTADASTNIFAISQKIEGFNFADMAWGTANAAPITLSFWVRSSLTGTFGGSVKNSASNRSYAFTYAISSANTWEQKTVSIAGDTSGTWLTTNGIGLTLNFGLGVGSSFSGTAGAWAGANYVSATGATSVVGTNGATFYITGVQLEKGSTATSFDYRPYGTELQLAQRYYYRAQATKESYGFGVAFIESATVGGLLVPFPVTMRTIPSALEQSGTASDYVVRAAGTSRTCSAVPAINASTTTEYLGGLTTTVASGQTAGWAGYMRSANANAFLAWSAEL